MNDITNTQDPEEQGAFLLMSLATGDPSAMIENQEARGQRELVNSTKLPVDLNGQNEQEFLDLGFTFGEKVAGDEIFREATLPDGWTRVGSGHSMWSYIADERGINRVAIFYKAAFYDRSAHMNTIRVGGEFVTRHMYWREGDPEERPVWSDKYTQEELAEALEVCEKRLADQWSSDETKAQVAKTKEYLEGFRADR